MIETFDTNLGRVVDALKAEGIADNTMVIFTSDNGGTLTTNYSSKGYWGNGTKEEILDIPLTSNHPKKQGKGTSWEGGTAVPFLVSWPSKLASGVVSEAFVSGTDIFPTVCEIAGVDIPKSLELDGVSMMGALQQQEPARTTLHGYWPNYFDRPGLKVSPAAWIRQGDHKLMRFFCDAEDQSDRLELYNLKKDPSEEQDIAKTMPELAKALNDKMTEHLKKTGALIPFANPQYNPSTKKGS
jgi:arylsulfatase A-like enzyme